MTSGAGLAASTLADRAGRLKMRSVYDDGLASCLAAFSAYDGIDSSLSAFGVVSSTPDSSTWPGGDRRLVCFADEWESVDYSIRGSRQ
jgi:hypothetical protein